MISSSRKPTVAIVDLGIQNVGSVVNAFELIGASTSVANSPSMLNDAGLVVVPGVGSFATASKSLVATGFGDALREHALTKERPIFGLCLGMQLLADGSTEHGWNSGLGLIPGRVDRLHEEPPTWRVPNMGWREVQLTEYNTVLPRNLDGRAFYHVHSYHLVCEESSCESGMTEFGGSRICVVVERDSVVGTQFHPEKSQDAGLDLLHAVWRKFG